MCVLSQSAGGKQALVKFDDLVTISILVWTGKIWWVYCEQRLLTGL